MGKVKRPLWVATMVDGAEEEDEAGREATAIGWPSVACGALVEENLWEEIERRVSSQPTDLISPSGVAANPDT